MSIEIKVPDLPESVSEATVGEWHKNRGDAVSQDENLVDLETDKVMLEVPATDNGVITEIRAEAGATVGAGDVLAIVEEGEAAATGDADGQAKEATDSSGGQPASQASGGSGASIEVKVPDLPESVSEATVGEWHKNQGDGVSQDENLVDLETDKVMLEVPAAEDGVITDIRVESGATVNAGDVLGVLEPGNAPAAAESGSAPSAEASEATADEAPQQGKSADVASPAARKLLEERGLNADDITGTGKDGRITKADVAQAAEPSGSSESAGEAEQTSAGEMSLEKADREAVGEAGASRAEQRVPMTRIRARIAERLLEATRNTAMLTTFNEVDLQAVSDLRERHKAQFENEHEARLGFMSFFVKATVEALKQFPIVNASIDEQDVVYHGYYDIGIAVSSPRGLLVPVLRDADQMSFAEVENQVRDFGKRAQNGKIGMDELTGGTFTITNGGAFGSLLSTPIINPPQSAILGMHGINEKPVVVDGEIVIRPMMYLAVSYDHRLIDGRDSVLFLKTIKEKLEDPARMLLQI